MLKCTTLKNADKWWEVLVSQHSTNNIRITSACSLSLGTVTHQHNVIPHRAAQFNAESFGCLDTPDADAMVTALHWNTHYTTFAARDLKLSSSTLDAMCLLARRTHCLHTLVLSRLGGVKADFWFTLSAALRANNACAVAAVDFSHNAIEDKGAFALAVAFSGMPLMSINLCDVGLGSKGAAAVAKACSHILDTLHTLRLGDNAIGVDGVKEIVKLFKGSNNLAVLDVENTG